MGIGDPLFGTQMELLGSRTGRLPRKPEVDHICCCVATIALCGANVAGQGVAFGNPEHSRTLCQICANKDADGERCGAKDCPGPERQG